MQDYQGREVTIRAQRGYQGYGTRPFSIVRRTVRGVRLLEATWHPTNNHALFRTKAECVKFIQAHEAIMFGHAPETP